MCEKITNQNTEKQKQKLNAYSLWPNKKKSLKNPT